jgi:hypothetical protein
MKPYEEITLSNGTLRWLREDGMYVCRMTEDYMSKIKAQHEVKRQWQGLTDEEIATAIDIAYSEKPMTVYDKRIARAIEAKLKEKNG